MHKLKKLYCRTFQAALRLSLPFLPYRNPKIVGSVNALPEILEKYSCEHVLIITDSGIRSLGLTKRLELALAKNGVEFSI